MNAFLLVAIIFFVLAALSGPVFKTGPAWLWSLFVAIGLVFFALSFAGAGGVLDLD